MKLTHTLENEIQKVLSAFASRTMHLSEQAALTIQSDALHTCLEGIEYRLQELEKEDEFGA
jgi:hypothetical protein